MHTPPPFLPPSASERSFQQLFVALDKAADRNRIEPASQIILFNVWHPYGGKQTITLEYYKTACGSNYNALKNVLLKRYPAFCDINLDTDAESGLCHLSLVKGEGTPWVFPAIRRIDARIFTALPYSL